jgi:conjugal transfer/entry exclusion protein
MRQSIRRRLFAVALMVVLQLPDARQARAQFGEDIPFLVGILTQTISTVADLASMLITLKAQLDAMNTMLSNLDSASFDSVSSLVSNTDFSLDALSGDVASMGYTLQSVNSQFLTLYGTSAYAALPITQFDALYGKWEDEVLSSAQVAARAQASLSTLAGTATEAAAILARSQSSDGQVAQMQAIVQMLGIMQSQDGAVIQSLTTTGRVLTSTAARTAAERQLSREKKRRHLLNYTYRGPDVAPMTMP